MYISKISFSSNNNHKSRLDNKDIVFSGSLSNNIPKSINEKTDNQESKIVKNKWVKFAGIGALLTAGAAGAVKLFKHAANPDDSLKIVKKLIKTLKPEDIQTAKEFYPVMLRNMESLGIEHEQFNTLMNAIKKENMPFMVSEGIDLISSKMNLLKECFVDRIEDFSTLFKSLTQKNKEMFSFVSGNRENLHVDCIDDLLLFLELNPAKQEHILKSLLPKLIKNEKQLNLKSAERYASILDKISPECEYLIQQIADFPIAAEKKINKYSVLKMVNKENKDCVIPLLKNLENSDYSTIQIQKILSVATGKEVPAIIAVSKHANTLAKLDIDYKKVQDLIQDENTAKVFDFIMEKKDFFNILEFADIKYCLKHIKADKLQYLPDELIELLKENKDLLGFHVPDMIADALKNADSSTLDTVKSVVKYAKEFAEGDNFILGYTALIGALNKDNAHKLPQLMQNIKQTNVWKESLVSIDSFKDLLDTIK